MEWTDWKRLPSGYQVIARIDWNNDTPDLIEPSTFVNECPNFKVWCEVGFLRQRAKQILALPGSSYP